MNVVNETVLSKDQWHHPKDGTEKWENLWLLLGDDTDHPLNPPLYSKLVFELVNKDYGLMGSASRRISTSVGNRRTVIWNGWMPRSTGHRPRPVPPYCGCYWKNGIKGLLPGTYGI